MATVECGTPLVCKAWDGTHALANIIRMQIQKHRCSWLSQREELEARPLLCYECHKLKALEGWSDIYNSRVEHKNAEMVAVPITSCTARRGGTQSVEQGPSR